MRVRNLTPHVVRFRVGADEAELVASSTVPRVQFTRERVGDVAIDGVEIPIFRTVPHEVIDLPRPELDTLLIVSRAVADACRDRDDLLVPDELIRDEEGRPTHALSLARLV